MQFVKGQIVRVKIGEKFAYGRVTHVSADGSEGKATFKSSETHVISATIIPEMVIEAIYCNSSKTHYGV